MLNRYGIRVRRGRNSALAALATDIPAAALSPLLGIGIGTAVRWTHRAKRDWQAYIQARAKAPAAPDRDSNGAMDAPATEQGASRSGRVRP